MARVWRDGQRSRTYVYRLLAAGSIEEKIFQRQVNKQGLAGAVVDAKAGDNQMPAFDAEQLRRLFCLDDKTQCETHDLLDCHCVTGNCRPTSDSVAHNDIRDCQLNISGAAYPTVVSTHAVSPVVTGCRCQSSEIFSVISPEMIYKTGQMSVHASVHPCSVNFQNPKALDRLADIDETWHAYCMGMETQILCSRILNFGPFATLGHSEVPNLAQLAEVSG